MMLTTMAMKRASNPGRTLREFVINEWRSQWQRVEGGGGKITNMAVFQQCFKFYEHIKPIISTPKIIISCMELINQACLFFFSHKLSMAMGHLIGGTHRIWPISLSNRYFLLLLSKLIQNKTRLSNRFFFPSFSSKNSLRTQSNTPLVS